MLIYIICALKHRIIFIDVARVREPGQPRCSQAVCRWRGKWSCLFKTLTLPSSSSAPTDWVFFFFKTICPLSPALVFLYFRSLQMNFTHMWVYAHLRTSEHQRGRREKLNEHTGVEVVGFWGPVFESVLWLGAHVRICMCESAFLLVTQWKTLRCVCLFFFFFQRVYFFLNPFHINLYEEWHDWDTNCFFFLISSCDDSYTSVEDLLGFSRLWSESVLCIFGCFYTRCVSVEANLVQLNK